MTMLTAPKVTMLRLQPTRRCNLNCSYCYIPAAQRLRADLMSQEVLETTLRRLVDEALLEDRLSISWHGAEPLMAGTAWYRDAFATIARSLGQQTAVTHIFQSNGALIDSDWCQLFLESRAQIGLSIDGDAQHDTARVNWAGRPSHPLAMRGAGLLNDHGVRWTMLSVITREVMLNPEAYIAFVRQSGCAALGFKVEETNVANTSRLAQVGDAEALFAEFVTRLWEAFPPESGFQIREFADYRARPRGAGGKKVVPVTLVPMRNLTVATNGDFTVFAGELLFGDDDTFVFGNVLDGPISACLLSDHFRIVGTKLLAGARHCADNCAYYDVCGAFYVSQKIAESGSPEWGETLACRLEIKTLYDTLDRITCAAAG